ncbi:hypothetical protein HOO65_060394 [Ceratocystis lukuohia]
MSGRRSARIAAISAAAHAARVSPEVDPEEILPQLERTRARSHAAAVAVVFESQQEQHTKKKRSGDKRCTRRQTRSTAKRRKMRMLPDHSSQQHRSKGFANADSFIEDAAEYSPPSSAREKELVWDNEPMLDCWAFILYHASVNEKDVVNISWLLNAATVCKSFAYGVNKVIWSHPWISSPRVGARLMSTLGLPSPENMNTLENKMHHRISMTRSLRIGPLQTQSLEGVSSLLTVFPRLTEIDIAFPEDPVLFDKCRYPKDLNTNLVKRVTDRKMAIHQLNTWRWNVAVLYRSIFLDKEPKEGEESESQTSSFEKAYEMHTVGPLRDLTTLHLEGIPSAWLDLSDSTPVQHPPFIQINSLILALKNLRTLTLDRCASTREFLVHLPSQLWHLSITKSLVESVDFEEYLKLRGHSLKTLKLRDNIGLTLRVFGSIAQCCPDFEEFYGSFSGEEDRIVRYWPFSAHADPEFGEWLPSHPISWPKKLRVLELSPIRGIRMEDIESILVDLVASAHRVPDLRRINLRITMDSVWRDRACFRERWHDVLRHVFEREVDPPLPYSSLAQYKALFRSNDAEESSILSTHSSCNHSSSSSSNSSSPAKMTRSRAAAARREGGQIIKLTDLVEMGREKGMSNPCQNMADGQSRRKKQYSELDSESDSSLSSAHDVTDDEFGSTIGSSHKEDVIREMAEWAYQKLDIDNPEWISHDKNSEFFRKTRLDIYGQLQKLPATRQVHTIDFMVDNMKPSERILGMEDFIDEWMHDDFDNFDSDYVE